MLDPGNQLLCAFDLGVDLNRFGWHWRQAVICASGGHRGEAAAVLARIRVKLVQLFPLDGDGTRKALDGITKKVAETLTTESYADLRSDAIDQLNQDPEYPEAALDGLIELAANLAAALDRLVAATLVEFPRLFAALRLGQAVDEGACCLLSASDFIVLERNPAWRLWRRKNGIPRDWSIGRPGPSIASRSYALKTQIAGENIPGSNWLAEVDVRCQQLGLTLATHYCAIPSGADERRQLFRRLKAQVRGQLKAMSNNVPPYVNGDLWPPDSGWHFREGEFALGGKPYRLPDTPLKLLRTVAEARFSLTSVALKEEVWGNTPDDDQFKCLRREISALNKKLRSLFKGCESIPQIAPVDRRARGKERLWHLVLKEAGSI